MQWFIFPVLTLCALISVGRIYAFSNRNIGREASSPHRVAQHPSQHAKPHNLHGFSNHNIVEFSTNASQVPFQMNDTVVVFTAWSKFKSVADYKPRVDHHVAYTKLHGFKYVIFTAMNLTSPEKALLGPDVEVIVVPGFNERTDKSSFNRQLQTGWLKVEGFQILFSRFSAPSLFFYIDMDVIFYNFQVSLASVFQQKRQSIFAQESTPGRMFWPSHAVAIRNTPVALRFVDDWASLMPGCPHLNMEQGAFMTTIARMLSGCTGNSELQCQTQCEKMCTSESYRSGRNGRFYACTSQYINKLLRQINRTINEHSHLHLYPQVPRFHWAPRDGFTVEKSSYNLTGSCPLTMHPYKDYNKEVMPSYNNCIDLPLVDTDRFPVSVEDSVKKRTATRSKIRPKFSPTRGNQTQLHW